MIIKKEIKDNNEFYLWFNGKLIFKKWLDQGYSKVFDHGAWGSYTDRSITDFDLEETPPLYHVGCYLNLYASGEGDVKRQLLMDTAPIMFLNTKKTEHLSTLL